MALKTLDILLVIIGILNGNVILMEDDFDDLTHLRHWDTNGNNIDCIPDIMFDDNSLRMQCNMDNFTEILRYNSALNINDYHDIKVILMMSTNNYTNINDVCGIEYSVDNGNDWIFWTGIYGSTEDNIINITNTNQDMNNISSIFVRLIFNGSTGNAYCNIHYIQISGQIIDNETPNQFNALNLYLLIICGAILVGCCVGTIMVTYFYIQTATINHGAPVHRKRSFNRLLSNSRRSIVKIKSPNNNLPQGFLSDDIQQNTIQQNKKPSNDKVNMTVSNLWILQQLNNAAQNYSTKPSRNKYTPKSSVNTTNNDNKKSSVFGFENQGSTDIEMAQNQLNIMQKTLTNAVQSITKSDKKLKETQL